MQRMYRMALGTVFCAAASTSALAQTGAKPIVLTGSVPNIKIEGPSEVDSLIRIYHSTIHAVALRGVTLTDSGAVKALISKQLTEWKSDEARKPLKAAATAAWQPFSAAHMAGTKPSAADTSTLAAAKAKVRQSDVAFFKKRLPELRAVLPQNQQAVFDQNLKALEESDYTLAYEDGRLVDHFIAWNYRPKK
jgi:hypothetical protein